METSYLSIAGLAVYFSISESKLYELQATGDFPLPCCFGRSKRWKVTEVEDYFKRHPIERRVRRAVARKGGAR